MTTFEFWRDRFFFFVGIWMFTMAVVSFVLIVSTEGVNTIYWNTIRNIGIRGIFNFGSYIIIFSLVIEFLSTYLPYSGKHIWLRLLISVLIGLFVAYHAAIINLQFPFPEALLAAKNNFLFILIISFFQCGMIFTTLEIWEMIKRNRKLNLSLSELEKERIRSQLQVLRQQINPHFLFNSLNVLSELVHEDTEKSDQFIQHFAKVYRYVLEINQEAVVTLQEEFDFLNSYIFLQKIRFGQNLKVTTKIPQTAIKDYIPPLSLQILFENAIKHNAVSKHKPLQIEIKCDEASLYMINNYQELNSPPQPSTGLGLKNLKNRYELISNLLPDFYIEDGRYIAKLPLIQLKA